MDLSKLPHRDPTGPAAPPPPAPPPSAPLPTASYAPAPVQTGGFAEAWLAIAIGVVLLILNPRLFQYLASPGTFNSKWSFNSPTGQPLAYTQTVFFWGDVVLALFAVTLLVEGIILGFVRKPAVVIAAIFFTALVAIANLAYVIFMLLNGYGAQLMSLIAVALGVYGCLVLAARHRALAQPLGA